MGGLAKEEVRALAARAGLEMPEEDQAAQERRNRRKRLLELNKQAARFYYETLKSPQGKPMRQYITKRKLNSAYVKRFGLGAAPDSWDSLIKAMTAQGFAKGELLEAGLVVAGKNGGIYDKFRNRLMLPVIDATGEILGFTSRVMDNSTPKYLNTPETAIFKKRSILYGIQWAKLTKRSFFLLVEGNLDVITLHQAGIDNAVATMGTALTADHARLIGKYTKELVLCYDNDAAGVEATQRAMTVLKDTGFRVRVLQLPRRKTPEGELVKQDPDDFIKFQGAAAFERLLAGSADQSEYRLETIQKKYDLTKTDERTAFLKEAAQMIAQLSSPVEREIYAGKAAEAASVSKEAMVREVEDSRRRRAGQQRRKEERSALTPAVNLQPQARDLRYQNVRSARAEEGLVRLLFLDSTLLNLCRDLSPEQFSSPLWGRIYAALSQGELPPDPAAFDAVLSGEEADLLARLLHTPQTLAEGRQAVQDYIAVIQEEARRNADKGDPLADLFAIQAKKKQKETTEDQT